MTWRTILSWEEISDDFIEEGQGFFTEEKNGNGLYRLNRNGDWHNTRGPAIIHADGSVEYWVNGKLHRTDGPAYIGSDGTVAYWVNDKLHRTDGPAIIRADGSVEYWVNGEELSEEEFNRLYGQNRQASLQVKAEDPTWVDFDEFWGTAEVGQLWELLSKWVANYEPREFIYIVGRSYDSLGNNTCIECKWGRTPSDAEKAFHINVIWLDGGNVNTNYYYQRIK